MAELILFTVLCVFALFGLCEIIHEIRLIFVSPKKRTRTVTLIYLEKGSAEQQLMFISEQAAWLGRKYSDRVIAVDTGISEEERKNCERIAASYSITLAGTDEITAAFS